MMGSLSGKRVVVTRSPEQNDSMCRQLEALGAVAITIPAINFIPLPAPELNEALSKLADFDWLLFTSGNAVRFFWERLAVTDLVLAPHYQLRIAAVGSATNQLLAEKGIAVDYAPDTFTGEALARGLGELHGKRVLLPRARIGRPEIVELLREQGAEVVDIALYDTVTADPAAGALAELERGVDAVTFTSPSGVRNFLKIVQGISHTGDGDLAGYEKIFSDVVIACIGPSTAEEAREMGLTVHVVPEEFTIEALISALAGYFTGRTFNDHL